MLDFNEELAKFQPCADLEEAEENIYGKELEEIKKNKTELYKANQMIKKYNQALNYAKQGNDDLAMLQLKNVVAAIPNFVDAYLLMALLSIKGENYDNARTFLDTILKIDPNNESAVEYGKEFETKVVEEEPQTTEPEKKDKKKKEKKKVVSQPEEPKKKKNPFNISSIQENEAGKSPMFYMVTGIVIGVIVAAVLIYPTVRASFSHKNSTQVEDYKEQILAKDTQLKASEKKVKEAKAAQKKAEDELDEYIGTSKKDGVYDLLLSALQKYSDRDYTGSADALLDIDSKKLTTKNMKAIYKDLTTKVYPSAMIVIDINKLKLLNDRKGHEAGDNQIKAVANVLIKTQRDNSEIMRTDGDEFMIYLVGYDEKKIGSYIHKLNRELLSSLPHKDYGVSIGYSMITNEQTTIDDAINDSLLMIKKSKGNE